MPTLPLLGAADPRGPETFALAYAAQRQALARSKIDDADRFAPELAHEGTGRSRTRTGEPILRLGTYDPFTLLYLHWVITGGHGTGVGWDPVFRDDSWSSDRSSWFGGFGGGSFGGGSGGGSSWGGGVGAWQLRRVRWRQLWWRRGAAAGAVGRRLPQHTSRRHRLDHLAHATRSDLDHRVDHSKGGLTLVEYLNPLCRHDHRLKDAGWKLQPGPGGATTWTSPPRTHLHHRTRPTLNTGHHHQPSR